MAKGSQQATSAATSAQNISTSDSANANALYGSLAPELESQAANPQGIDPTTMAEMNTEALQTAGGSQAGAVGQGGLQAARTRNVGGSDAAITKSARTAGQTASQGVLGNQLASAKMKQQEMESAQGGLENLYGVNTGASVNSLGEVAQNVNANENAAAGAYDLWRYTPLAGPGGST